VGYDGISTFSSVLESELKLILPSYIDEECFLERDVAFAGVVENIEGMVCGYGSKVGRMQCKVASVAECGGELISFPEHAR